MDEKLIEYAPIVIVILMFIWQNNVFVRPEQLEKKHREILDDVDEKFKNKYVELNAYKEFQSHVLKGIEDANTSINELKEFLIGKGRG